MKRSEIREHGRESRIALRSMRATVIGGSKKNRRAFGAAAWTIRDKPNVISARPCSAGDPAHIRRRPVGSSRPCCAYAGPAHISWRRRARSAAVRARTPTGPAGSAACCSSAPSRLPEPRSGRRARGLWQVSWCSPLVGPSPTRRYSQGFGNLAALFGGGALLRAESWHHLAREAAQVLARARGAVQQHVRDARGLQSRELLGDLVGRAEQRAFRRGIERVVEREH